LPYKSLSSYLIASEKEFVHPGEMAKWMNPVVGAKCALILWAPRVHSNWGHVAMYSI
jgi:hypothetical protein